MKSVMQASLTEFHKLIKERRITMKIRITAKNEMDEIRILGTVVTDSVNRALQMYEDEIVEGECMYYEIID